MVKGQKYTVYFPSIQSEINIWDVTGYFPFQSG